MTSVDSSIPTYYADTYTDVPYEKQRDNPAKDVKVINNLILQLHPKKALLNAIIGIAASILMVGYLGGACFYFATSILGVSLMIIHLGFSLMCASLVLDTYKEENEKYYVVKEKISKLYSECSPKDHEFKYMDHIRIDAGLSEEEFSSIKRHLLSECISKNIHLKVSREFHYRLSGGEVSSWSIKPLQCTLKETKDNKDRVLEQYKPWIDLLLSIENSDELSKENKDHIGKMIGYMIHRPSDILVEIIEKASLRIARNTSTVKAQLFYCSSKTIDGKKTYFIIGRKNGEEKKLGTASELDLFIKEYMIPEQEPTAC